MRHAVDIHGAIDEVDRLAARGNNALDERATRDFRVFERHDVAGLRLMRVIGDFLGPHVVAHFNGVLHRARGNRVREYHEVLEQPHQTDYENDVEHPRERFAQTPTGA